MLGMNFALRWSWVLGIALFLPVSLPAGGGETIQSDFYLSESPNSLLSVDSSLLQSSPFAVAPVLSTLAIGTPLKVLRRWKDSDGQLWLQVKIISSEIIDFSPSAKRGWINA